MCRINEQRSPVMENDFFFFVSLTGIVSPAALGVGCDLVYVTHPGVREGPPLANCVTEWALQVLVSESACLAVQPWHERPGNQSE